MHNPDWDEEVRALTGGGVGVHHVLDLGGEETVPRSLEAMNAFIVAHEIRPVIDRVFEFDKTPAAFDFMRHGDYMGKIVTRH